MSNISGFEWGSQHPPAPPRAPICHTMAMACGLLTNPKHALRCATGCGLCPRREAVTTPHRATGHGARAVREALERTSPCATEERGVKIINKCACSQLFASPGRHRELCSPAEASQGHFRRPFSPRLKSTQRFASAVDDQYLWLVQEAVNKLRTSLALRRNTQIRVKALHSHSIGCCSMFLTLLTATLRRQPCLERSISVTRIPDSDILKSLFPVVIQSEDDIGRLRQISFARTSPGLPASGRAKPRARRSR